MTSNFRDSMSEIGSQSFQVSSETDFANDFRKFSDLDYVGKIQTSSDILFHWVMSDYYHEIFFPAGVAVAFLSRAFKSSMFTVISPSQYELWAIERYHLHQSFAFFLDVPGTTHRFNSRPLGYLDEGKMVEQVTERWIKLWKSHNYPHRTPLLINLLNPVRNDSPVTLLLLYYKFTWLH